MMTARSRFANAVGGFAGKSRRPTAGATGLVVAAIVIGALLYRMHSRMCQFGNIA
jgi:hypothetical protein